MRKGDEKHMEKKPKYNKQVILSTDGKHTVIVSANTAEEMAEGIKWAVKAYEGMVKKYGLKHEQYAKSLNGQTNGNSTVPSCAVHKTPMVRVNGKYGAFWSCRQRSDDGSFCRYKPQTQV